MKILAIDTTKKSAQIATQIENEKSTYVAPINSSHSESLMVAIDEILTKKQTKINDIDVFGIVVGPGSFTGIRIGVSVVKAFMFNAKSKAVAVNSFDLVAYNINSKKLNGNFYVGLNADKKGVYLAEFNKEKQIKDIKVLGFDAVNELIEKSKKQLFVSENSKEFFETNNVKANFVEMREHTLVELILGKTKNEEFIEPNSIEPLYIKLSQAENQFLDKIKTQVKTQKATIKDTQALFEIEQESFYDTVWNKEMFESELKQNNKHYFKLIYNNEVLGFVGTMLAGDELEILNLAIKKDFRKAGFATLLMNQVLDFAIKNKVKNLFLEVRLSNFKAFNLYKKLGFTESYTRKKYYDNGEDALVMTRSI